MLNGIDISNHQGGINLGSVIDRNNVDFVIMKATEGNGFTDKWCDSFYQTCKEKNVLRGVYHFARNTRNSAKAESDWFIKETLGYVGDCIPVLDWEDVDTSDVAWALEWLRNVEKAWGCKPLIYMNESTANRHDWSSVVKENYGIWVAKYSLGYQQINGFDISRIYPEKVNQWEFVAMYQYTSSGYLQGFNNALDMNLFYGTREQFMKYYSGSEIVEDKPVIEDKGFNVNDVVEIINPYDIYGNKITLWSRTYVIMDIIDYSNIGIGNGSVYTCRINGDNLRKL